VGDLTLAFEMLELPADAIRVADDGRHDLGRSVIDSRCPAVGASAEEYGGSTCGCYRSLTPRPTMTTRASGSVPEWRLAW
jgi:hypothetical protein